MTERYATQYLSFSPELECLYCQRYTHIGIHNFPGINPSLHPVCALHGYLPCHKDGEYEADTLPAFAEQAKGVIRFVLWTQGNCGTVLVVEPVEDVNALPGYIRYEHQNWTDEGWRVEYVSPDGKRKELFVSYGIEDDQFWLLEDGSMWDYNEDFEERRKQRS